MGKKEFQKEHRIGITAVICLLLGAVIAFAYMYLNGNKITIMQKNDNTVYSSHNKNKHTADSAKTYTKPKRYNIYNYYYGDKNSPVKKSSLQTDTLPPSYKEGFTHYQTTKKENLILDLNSCDTLDLQMIRGIGPAYSRRIYKYREKLGGYTTVVQLKEIYGMSDSLYRNIEKHFVINNKNLRKLNINTLSLKELAAHPYIDWFLAKEIIIFRQNNGKFTDINQLKLIHIMDDSVFNKLSPYISLE